MRTGDSFANWRLFTTGSNAFHIAEGITNERLAETHAVGDSMKHIAALLFIAAAAQAADITIAVTIRDGATTNREVAQINNTNTAAGNRLVDRYGHERAGQERALQFKADSIAQAKSALGGRATRRLRPRTRRSRRLSGKRLDGRRMRQPKPIWLPLAEIGVAG